MSDIHDLAAFYALDALDADDRARFTKHLPDCQSCQAELADLAGGVEHLAQASAEAAPSSIRDAVMASIDDEVSTPERADLTGATVPIHPRRRRRFGALVGVAAATVAAVVLLGVLNRPSPIDVVLDASDAMTLALADTPVGAVQIVWSDVRQQAVFVGSEVPRVDAGLVYALWLIDDSGATPAGLFVPDASGNATVLIDGSVTSGSTLGLTVEPEAGSPAPTGDILIAEELA